MFMKKLIVISGLFFLSLFVKAQDSTRILTHEIGFNTVSLIKQILSNSPATTVPQLPYDFFYNMYYKDKIGLRLGAGIATTYTETVITGQNIPRTTSTSNLQLRTGLSYNFVNTKRLTLNGFTDYLLENISRETANTTTAQAFPNPVQKITTETSDKTKGSGFQFGVGIKYNIHKHLSVYAEAPFSFMAETTTSDVKINDTGTIEETNSTIKTSGTRFFVPTTVYLVLRF
jgi:hypothetical protein